MNNKKDIERAKEALEGHSIALCLGDTILTSDKRGIAPMVDFISNGVNLQGYSVADLVVGKAAAMLFSYAGIKEVFAKTMSKIGAKYLDKVKIPYTYELLTDKIINRTGDDICPMEKTVWDIEDEQTALILIKDKLMQLKKKNI